MGRALRCVTAIGAGVFGLAMLLRWHPSGFAATTADRAEAAMAGWALWGLTAYLVAAVVATALATLVRADLARAPRHLAWLGRLLAGAGAVSIALVPVTASATPATVPAADGDPLGWAASAALVLDPPAIHGEAVTVRTGDTLWAIAGRALGSRDPAQIAATWPRWYATNAAVIGPDPDRIVPGQRLTPPAPSPRRS